MKGGDTVLDKDAYVFWVYVKKDDNVFVTERQPRRKIYVVEEYAELGEQHYRHVFHLIKDGENVLTKKMESHHGFDRGPRRRGIIKRMILEG